MAESDPLLLEAVAQQPVSQEGSRPRFFRWILLAQFCGLAFLQNSIFVAWNPIANSALFAFNPDWTPATLAWQINLATITSPLIQIPVWYTIKKHSCSQTIKWGAVLPLVISTGLSSLPLVINVSTFTYKWLTYMSFLFTGLTGVVFFSSITRFSSTWFPEGERATATGLACTMANLGGLLPSIVGPQVVSDPNKAQDLNVDDVKHQLYLYMFMFFVLAVLLMISFVVHFPKEPVSEEATLGGSRGQLQNVLRDITTVTRIPSVLILVLVASLGSIPHIWGSTLLTVTLASLKISQTSIGAVTISALILSTVLTVLTTRLADLYFAGNLKLLIVNLLALHAPSMIGLCVLIMVPRSDPLHPFFVAIFYVLGMALLNCSSPLVLELAAELTFPVSEDVVSGLINQSNNLVGVIFYLSFSYFLSFNINWLLYLLMVVPVLTFVMFTFVRETYNRSVNST